MNCYFKDEEEYVFIVDASLLSLKKRKEIVEGIEKLIGERLKELAPTTSKTLPGMAEEPAESAEADLMTEEFAAGRIKEAIVSQGDKAFVYYTEAYRSGNPSSEDERKKVRDILNRYAVRRLISVTEQEMIRMHEADSAAFAGFFQAVVSETMLREYKSVAKEKNIAPTMLGCLMWASDKYKAQMLQTSGRKN